MTVLFFPDFTGGNPYQSNLAERIADLGEPVALGSQAGLFPIFRSYRNHDDVSVVHFHWLHPYIFCGGRVMTAIQFAATIFQILLIQALGTPVVWTCHNVESHGSKFPQLESTFKYIFVRFGLCDWIFVHSEAVTDDLIERYGLSDRTRERVTVIKHGHYIDNYRNCSTQADARAELGVSEAEIVFLFFGQIRPYKGIIGLVKAFRSITDSDYRLVIAGEQRSDRLEGRLKRAAQSDDRIQIHSGFVSDHRVHVYMNAADVVVLPYDAITTSGSAILAMSFGRAIVAPQIGTISDLLDEKGAVMYDPDDSNALCDALVMASSRNLSKMGEHNYRLVEEDDWRSTAKRTMAVYNALTT